MEDRYDTSDRAPLQNGNHGAGFTLGLLAGAVLGAGLGMLFAPRSGAEMRGRLSEEANEFASTASRQYKKAATTVNDLAEKGRGIYDSAREAVKRGAEEAQRYVRDTERSVSGEKSVLDDLSAPGSDYTPPMPGRQS